LLQPDSFFETHDSGAPGCAEPPNPLCGGMGGDGAHAMGSYADDGEPGADGPSGAEGQVIFEQVICPSGDYRVTDLGQWNNTPSHGTALNDAGWVVGGSEVAFVWAGGTMYSLTDAISEARDINSKRQIVGRVLTDEQEWRAFLWLPEGDCGQPAGMNELPTLEDQPQCCANAINEHTNVVGHAGSGEYSDSEAFLWLCGTLFEMDPGMHNINPETPSCGSLAYDLNEGHTVAGSVECWDPPAIWEDASVWHPLTGWQPVRPYSDLYGISNGSVVVGTTWGGSPFYSLPSWDHVDLPVLWDAPHYAVAVNEQMQIVGYAEMIDSAGMRACLWEDGDVHDLNSLIAVDEGWVLTGAADINEAGQIVATGRWLLSEPDDTHALLLTPYPCQGLLVGDTNCDGDVGLGDINPFVLSLADPASYAVTYNTCNWLCACDVNGDGLVDVRDINPFVQILTR
jgi:uncharacterized membrane protein